MSKPAAAASAFRKDVLVESIFNHVNEGIVVTGIDGEILLINPAAERQFGYSSEELAGQPVETLIPDQYRKKHVAHRAGYGEAPVSRRMGIGRDLFGRKKDGTVFPVEVSLTPFKSDGKALVIAFIIDITVRKRIEGSVHEKQEALEKASQQLKASNELLEKKVYDRTQVLREALNALEKSKSDLSKSLAKEKELNELKTRFLSMASHEFRTPLTAILSSAGLVGEYPGTEQQEKRMKHVERIKSAVMNMTDILNDFLSISRIEEGRIAVEYTAFGLKELIDDVCSEVRATARPGQLLECRLEGGDTVVLDKKLLRQVLVNLLSNAVKYSEENKPIAIHAVHKNNKLIIDVADQGIGISPADQEHLFERFYRGENASNIQGTGLGLNIVAECVELLNGIITFRSELHKGSVFTVQFPVKPK